MVYLYSEVISKILENELELSQKRHNNVTISQ